MKLKRENLLNFTIVVVLALVLLTPVGFHARVFVSRIVALSPSELPKEEQFQMPSYHWQLSGLNGEAFHFKEVKGEVVLVNFWATWCPPCVAEMPSLQALYTDYKTKIQFVMVAQDQHDKVKAFMNQKKYDFPVYFETSAKPQALSPEYIPTTFIIDKNGNIVIEKTGAANWNHSDIRKVVDDLLK